MVEPQRHPRVHGLYQHPRERHPRGVRHQRDGNGGERQGQPGAPFRLGEVRVDHRQGQERDERSDAAARFGHLEAHGGQINDVPLAEHRHVEDVQGPRGQARGLELKWEGDLVQCRRRQRDHKEQIGEGKGDHPQHVRTAQEEGQPGEHHQEGKPRRIPEGPRLADDEEDQAHQEHQVTPRGSLHQAVLQALPALPDQVGADDGDEEAVGVILVGPPLAHEIDQHGIVQVENGRPEGHKWDRRGERRQGGAPLRNEVRDYCRKVHRSSALLPVPFLISPYR